MNKCNDIACDECIISSKARFSRAASFALLDAANKCIA